jgi:hypothetical protein
MTVRVVPDINALLTAPEQVNKLDPGDVRTLITQLAALLVLLSTRAAEPPPISVLPDLVQWLSAEQVTQQFGLSPGWIAEHRRLLASLRVTARVSRKTVLFDPRKLRRFIESRRAANSDGAYAHQARE